MSRRLSDSELNHVLDIFGYSSDRIVWAVEILQGRIDIKTIKCEHHPVDRMVYQFSDQEITESAQHAAIEQLRHKIREGA